MNFRSIFAAAAIVAVSAVASYGQTSATTHPVKKHTTTRKAKTPASPSVEEQIQALRHELEGKIDSLKTDLADKDAQLQKAQQAAADAQASAAKAEAAASSQQQAVTENTNAVTTLQSSVTDLKGNQASLATTISDATTEVKKSIANPNALRYKGITITPGGFMAAETVYRQKATGADIPTALSSIPMDNANAASLSEFYGSGRQSRLSLLAEGKTSIATIRGYAEVDFLGTGTNSNNNQSNSYVLRQRAVWAQAVLNNGLTFQGGQMWSLAVEHAKGLSNFSGDIKTPQTIDPNYLPGFVWARQYGFAVIKSGKQLSYGISLENAQTLQGGSNCPTVTVSGVTSSACLWGTASAQSSSFNAVNGTYSYNLGPDIIAKVAVDPGWGHYEAFAIGRFPHYEYYPNYASTTVSKTSGSFTDSLPTGGFGGSLRAPVFGKYGDFGLSGLYGWGVGRYGDTTLADVTFDAKGRMKALTNVSGLATVELHPTPRLVVYVNYGEDFVGRLDNLAAGANAGYGLLNANNSGCNVQSTTPTSGTASSSGGTCNGNNKFVQETVAGMWYDFYKGAAGRVRLGLQYGNINRAIWGGATTPEAVATENQFYTSFRYYLP
jgi:hypothetical protein